MNAKSIQAWAELPSADVYNYLQKNGLTLKLRGVTLAKEGTPEGTRADTVIPGTDGITLRAVAFNAMDLFKSQVEFINPQNATTQNLIGAMQGAGIFTAAEVAAFWKIFQVKRSCAEELLGRDVTAQDIAAARLYPKLAQTQTRALWLAQGTNRAQGELSSVLESLSQGIDAEVPSEAALLAGYSEGTD